MNRGKRKCVKGNSCGNSCISKLKVCRKELHKKPSEVLDSRVKTLPKKLTGEDIKRYLVFQERLFKGGLTPINVLNDAEEFKAKLKRGETLTPQENDILQFDLERKKLKLNTQEGMDALMEYRREKIRKDLVERHGEELVEKAEDNLKNLLEKSYVRVRVPSETILNSIIEEGFKNQFETGTSGGLLSGGTRRLVEETVLGIPLEDGGKTRPVYGYLWDEDSNKQGAYDGSQGYGYIQIDLKEDVKKNTKFTVNDSLNYEGRIDNSLTSSKMEEPSLAAMFRINPREMTLKSSEDESRASLMRLASSKDVGDIKRAFDRSPYMEAHIGKPLKATDIKRIMVDEWYSLDPKIVSWAKDNGIEVGLSINDGKEFKSL